MMYFEGVEINKEAVSPEYTITKEEIISFAKKWDPYQFHTDEEEAKKWPLGLTASSIHSYAICSMLANKISTEWPAVIAALGVDEMRMHAPVRPGDVLHCVSSVVSKRESKSKPDCGIVTALNKLVNQKGETALSYKVSSLILKNPEPV